MIVNRFTRHTPLILLLFVMLFAGACTIQKRVHRKGWFVYWNHDKKVSESTCENKSKSAIVNSDETDNVNNHDAHLVSESTTRVVTNASVSELEVKDKRTSEREFKDLAQDHLGQKELLEKRETAVVSSTESSSSHKKNQNQSNSPTRIPLLAWALLFLGCILIALAIVLGLIYLAVNGALIGAPLYMGVLLLAGVIFLVLATRTALAPLNSQPPPDPRTETEEPKREKKEREPLKENDKIFLGVIAGLILIIAISLLSY